MSADPPKDGPMWSNDPRALAEELARTIVDSMRAAVWRDPMAWVDAEPHA